jgi:hypothetical protein
VEKQNTDVGLLPLVADESHHYGYQEENRHMTAAFAQGRAPAETLDDGLLVTELLMTCSHQLGLSACGGGQSPGSSLSRRV